MKKKTPSLVLLTSKVKAGFSSSGCTVFENVYVLHRNANEIYLYLADSAFFRRREKELVKLSVIVFVNYFVKFLKGS